MSDGLIVVSHSPVDAIVDRISLDNGVPARCHDKSNELDVWDLRECRKILSFKPCAELKTSCHGDIVGAGREVLVTESWQEKGCTQNCRAERVISTGDSGLLILWNAETAVAAAHAQP